MKFYSNLKLFNKINYQIKKNFSISSSTISLSLLIEESILNFRYNPLYSASTSPSSSISIDGNSMNLKKLIELGNGMKIHVSNETMKRLQISRDIVDNIVNSGIPTYGINTGFGLLSHTNVSKSELTDLQHNLIRSHASGVGEPLSPDVVRRIMALRINTLARGRSGVSIETFQKLVDLFNSGCTPEVPAQGTVGASGDLAPLAHIALGLIGEGNIYDPKHSKYLPAKEVLSSYGLSPASLQAKDGLSLVNGTQFITGVGSFALQGGINCIQVIQAIASLGLVSIYGHMSAMDPRVFECRPHVGSILVSQVIRGLIPPGTHQTTTKDVQDYYSIR